MSASRQRRSCRWIRARRGGGSAWKLKFTNDANHFHPVCGPIGTYSVYVYAVDGSGNKSQRSNTVSATPPPDTTAPTAPIVSVVGVNPTEVSLEWTASTDDGPYLFYQVFVNGSPSVDARQNRFAVVQGLTPETT
jgi:hypothetical protein